MDEILLRPAQLLTWMQRLFTLQNDYIMTSVKPTCPFNYKLKVKHTLYDIQKVFIDT